MDTNDIGKTIVIIYLVDIEKLSLEDILVKYKEYLKDEDIKKMERFKFELNKKQSLISSILKNKYVHSDIYYNEHKKPLSDSIFFNVSHSKNYVIIALNDKYPIGVDIEYIKDNINSDLINHVCNQEEINSITDNKTFFYYWTRKEAVLKCQGIGIGKDLKNVLNNSNYYVNSNYLNDYVYSIALDCDNNIKIIEELNYETNCY